MKLNCLHTMTVSEGKRKSSTENHLKKAFKQAKKNGLSLRDACKEAGTSPANASRAQNEDPGRSGKPRVLSIETAKKLKEAGVPIDMNKL